MKKSRILETVHETAQGLYEAGVMDQVTMREFDLMCLPKIEKLEPQKIKAIRIPDGFFATDFVWQAPSYRES